MEINKHTVVGMLKREYSKLIGIPASTLRRYMNKLYFDEMAKLDYTRGQNYLTPKQINFLNEKLVIT